MIEEEVVHHRLDYRSDREGDLFDQGPRVAHGKPIDYDDEAGGSQRGGCGWHHSVWSAGGVLVPAVLLLAAGVSLPGWLVVCVFAMICARIRLRPAQTVFPNLHLFFPPNRHDSFHVLWMIDLTLLCFMRE